jgi:hypothetical protein
MSVECMMLLYMQMQDPATMTTRNTHVSTALQVVLPLNELLLSKETDSFLHTSRLAPS